MIFVQSTGGENEFCRWKMTWKEIANNVLTRGLPNNSIQSNPIHCPSLTDDLQLQRKRRKLEMEGMGWCSGSTSGGIPLIHSSTKKGIISRSSNQHYSASVSITTLFVVKSMATQKPIPSATNTVGSGKVSISNLAHDWF